MIPGSHSNFQGVAIPSFHLSKVGNLSLTRSLSLTVTLAVADLGSGESWEC